MKKSNLQEAIKIYDSNVQTETTSLDKRFLYETANVLHEKRDFDEVPRQWPERSPSWSANPHLFSFHNAIGNAIEALEKVDQCRQKSH